MKGSGKTINYMDRVFLHGQMEECTKGPTLKMPKAATEFTHGQTVRNSKVSG